MEVTEANLQLLAGYLQQTLSADPNVRRPGECVCGNVCAHGRHAHSCTCVLCACAGNDFGDAWKKYGF